MASMILPNLMKDVSMGLVLAITRWILAMKSICGFIRQSKAKHIARDQTMVCAQGFPSGAPVKRTGGKAVHEQQGFCGGFAAGPVGDLVSLKVEISRFVRPVVPIHRALSFVIACQATLGRAAMRAKQQVIGVE